MTQISFPYGKKKLIGSFKDNELIGVLESGINNYKTELSGEELVKEALKNPVGSESLSLLAKDKENIVIIASDHTRPVPSKIII